MAQMNRHECPMTFLWALGMGVETFFGPFISFFSFFFRLGGGLKNVELSHGSLWRIVVAVAKRRTVVALGLACGPRVSKNVNSHKDLGGRGREMQKYQQSQGFGGSCVWSGCFKRATYVFDFFFQFFFGILFFRVLWLQGWILLRL